MSDCRSAGSGSLFAVKAARIIPVASDVLENGYLVIRDGRIEAVTASLGADAGIPVEDYGDAVIFPGIIDASSHLGINKEPFNYYSEIWDGMDSAEMISPEMRAADAVNPRDKALDAAGRFGITAVYAAAGHGNLVDGRGTVIKLRTAETAGEMILAGTEQMNFTVGAMALATARDEKKPPRTRMGMMKMLRDVLREASALVGKDKESAEWKAASSAAKELVPVTAGKMTARMYAETAQDIVLAVELAEEFGLNYILDGAQEAFLLPEFMKRHRPKTVLCGVPFGPMQTTVVNTVNLDLRTAGMLEQWGCPLALTADAVTNTARLPMFAGLQTAYGLSRKTAYCAITIEAAKMLNIGDRTGSLEQGKDADFAVWTGDPLENTSACLGTWVDGKRVYSAKEAEEWNS